MVRTMASIALMSAGVRSSKPRGRRGEISCLSVAIGPGDPSMPAVRSGTCRDRQGEQTCDTSATLARRCGRLTQFALGVPGVGLYRARPLNAERRHDMIQMLLALDCGVRQGLTAA